MRKLHSILTLLVFVLIAFTSCSEDEDTSIPVTDPPNILLIIADDLGKDAIHGYIEGSIKPSTPHIDAIRTNGLTFNNFWVNPTCTPTRATIITGKYGYRTDVKGVGDVLSSSEITLHQYITDNSNHEYASAVIGKWHLSGTNTSINPESFGIDYYAGLIRGAVDDYYQWQLTEDGTTSLQTNYTTEAFTDLAINWVNDQQQPWFLWLAYNAPHTPFHLPPDNMHSQGALAEYTPGMDATPYYMAAIEAMDFQIGKFLDHVPEDEMENTVIIFIGDNGTPNQVAQSPFTSSSVKNTLYQGGINVPMLISGSGVSRLGIDNNLITGTDLFATICELAGLNTNEYEDSKSFKSLLSSNANSTRQYQYSEIEDDLNDAWTISNGQYKLLVNSDGNEEMYYLVDDPYEQINLLNGNLTSSESNAKAELEIELANIRR